MARKITIPVLAYATDSGDGSGNVRLYNTREELMSDMHFDEAKMQEVEAEEDTYENGMIDNETIEIEIDDNGKAKLAKFPSFTTGSRQ